MSWLLLFPGGSGGDPAIDVLVVPEVAVSAEVAPAEASVAVVATPVVRVATLTPENTRPARAALSHLRHLLTDTSSDTLLGAFVTGLMTGTGRIHQVAHGDHQLRPWEAITDPATCPPWALPYAAQWTGGLMPGPQPGEAPAEYTARARNEVVFPRGMRRGSLTAVTAAVRATLTGGRTVILRERDGGDPWAVRIQTYSAETPDDDATRRAAHRFAPAGLVMTVEAIDGQTYGQLDAAYEDYDAVDAAYGDYDDVRTDAP